MSLNVCRSLPSTRQVASHEPSRCHGQVPWLPRNDGVDFSTPVPSPLSALRWLASHTTPDRYLRRCSRDYPAFVEARESPCQHANCDSHMPEPKIDPRKDSRRAVIPSCTASNSLVPHKQTRTKPMKQGILERPHPERKI
jgi:hypothetical protein